MVRKQIDGVDLKGPGLTGLSKSHAEPLAAAPIGEQGTPELDDNGERIRGLVDFPSQMPRYGGMIPLGGRAINASANGASGCTLLGCIVPGAKASA